MVGGGQRRTVNPESGLCLDDPNATTTEGTQLQLYTCNGTGAQDWTLPAATAGTGALDASVGSGLCLHDRSASTTNGNAIQIYTCNSTAAQNWTIEPDGTIRVL